MAIEPEAFLLAACLLGVATVVRVASASVPFSLAAAAGDALVGLGITSAILLATGAALELPVLYVGAAVFAGLYWTGVAEKRPRLSTVALALSALAAALGVSAVLLLARLYQWWFAPLGLVSMMALGLAAQGIGRLVTRQPPAVPAAPSKPTVAPPAAKVAAPTIALVQPPQGLANPAPPTKVTITCPSCGLRGQVAASGPPTLKCPRCAAPVTRPQKAVLPPPGGAGGPRRLLPPGRGPSS